MLYSRPAEAEWATTVWDDETGETWAQALERFLGGGRAFDAAEAVTLHPDTEVMSFGYGDDPVNFDGINVSDLLEALEEGDTIEDLDRDWGPFTIWEGAD